MIVPIGMMPIMISSAKDPFEEYLLAGLDVRGLHESVREDTAKIKETQRHCPNCSFYPLYWQHDNHRYYLVDVAGDRHYCTNSSTRQEIKGGYNEI